MNNGKEERMEQICQYVTQCGITTIGELSKYAGVSESTVRRDVERLTKQRRVIQEHGCVIASDRNVTEPLYNKRRVENVESKRVIGRVAARLIADDSSIFVEGGTTLLEMVRCIEARNVTIVTPDLIVATELAQNPTLTTVVLGGYIWRGSYTLVGELTRQNMSRMHFSYYFTSPGGISPDGRLSYYNIQFSEIREMAEQAASKIIVVCDDSKFGKSGITFTHSLSDVDVLVTNALPEDYRTFVDGKIRVLLPDENEQASALMRNRLMA